MDSLTVTKKAYDIIVVGGGIAGIAASVSAAREGKSVLLLEKEINLGGLATVGLISWYEPLCDGAGKQMIGGICEELIRLAVRSGFDNLPAKFGGEGKFPLKRERFASFYSPTFFELALTQYVIDAGVDILFDSRATFPVMEGNACKGVIVENVGGREFYPAKVVVDASGDATIAHRAGVPTEDGENFLTYVAHDFDYESAKKYAESGDLRKFRRWKNSGSTLSGEGHPEGMKKFKGTSAEELTEFVIIGKQRMLKKYEGTDKDSREIMMIPSIPQFRTVRHIVGDTVFDGEEESFTCESCIGACGDFRKTGKHYALPYSVLYNSAFPNILTAGRIISARGEGWEITRVIPVCALTGEAAGYAAAIAVEDGCPVSEVNYEKLREKIKKNNGIFFD